MGERPNVCKNFIEKIRDEWNINRQNHFCTRFYNLKPSQMRKILQITQRKPVLLYNFSAQAEHGCKTQYRFPQSTVLSNYDPAISSYCFFCFSQKGFNIFYKPE